jgi:hypothetical protein
LELTPTGASLPPSGASRYHSRRSNSHPCVFGRPCVENTLFRYKKILGDRLRVMR